jgi:ankyrin repeat protein
MRRTRRVMLLTVALPVLLAGILILLTGLDLRQIQRNQALIAAVKRNDATSVATLLAQGADANARDGTGRHLSIRNLLLDRLFGKHSMAPAGPTALMVAMDTLADHPYGSDRQRIDYSPVVMMLLAKGADPNVVDGRSLTPLIISARRGDYICLQALLAHGARVDTEDFFHGTALEYATWASSLECVQALLDHRAAVNHRDDRGNDALLGAADQNRLDIIRVLLDHGADPKAANRSGTTALSLMVRNGNTAGVKLLIGKGANPGASDVMGRSCLYWLRGKPHSEIAVLLRQAGATR